MAITVAQAQTIWTKRMQLNNPRYAYMSATQQAAFNADLATIFPTVQNFVLASYGMPTDLNSLYELDLDTTTDENTTLSTPAPISPVRIHIGSDKYGNPITVSVSNSTNQYISSVIGFTNNLNFYSGDNVDVNGNTSPNTQGLTEVWQYNANPLLPSSTRIYARFKNDYTTWDPLNPDQFALNQYFLVNDGVSNIQWVTSLDPTQTIKWVNGIPFKSNQTALDVGLYSGQYNPNHPEYINSGWSLVSNVSNMWTWAFNYSDSTYRIIITKQTDNTYLHAQRRVFMTPNQWSAQYVGIQTGISSSGTIIP